MYNCNKLKAVNFLILTISLIFLLPLNFAVAKNTNKYVKMAGYDCGGNDIACGPNSSKAVCESQCSNNTACVAYNYFKNPANNQMYCCLKKACPTNLIAQHPYGDNIALYVELSMDPGTIQDYTNVVGYDCRGNDIRCEPQNSKSTCESQCTTDNNCVAYNYFKNSSDGKNWCCRKQACKAANIKTHPYGQNIELNIKKAASGKDSYKSFPGMDCRGNDLECSTVTNRKGCEAACSQNHYCLAYNYFTWTDGSTRCCLKKACNYIKPHPLAEKITVYVKGSLVKEFDNKYTELLGHDCMGNDLSCEQSNDIGSCEQRCSGNSKCVAFNFFKHTDNKTHCCLKSSCTTDNIKPHSYNGNINLFVKKSLESSYEYVANKAKDCGGNDIECKPVTNRKGCEAVCNSKANCAAYNYFKNPASNNMFCCLKNSCKVIKPHSYGNNITIFVKSESGCSSSSDCPAIKPVCNDNNTCISCSGNTPYYDKNKRVCVECLNPNHCPSGEVCKRSRNGMRKCMPGGRPGGD